MTAMVTAPDTLDQGEMMGEVVAQFGDVDCHLILSPLDGGAQWGIISHPTEYATRETLGEDQDRATAWAYRQGFVWASHEPLPHHDPSIALWGLRAIA